MKTSLYLSTVIISGCIATSRNSLAQCMIPQDCTALGYTETSCPNGGIKCPFGSKWFCGGNSATVCKQEGFTNACTGAGQFGKGESCANLYKQCSCQSSYKYACSGEGYAGGDGAACNGKYTACKCSNGYEWKNNSCQQQITNDSQGDLYYCNDTVVGVKANGMNFYVAMEDHSYGYWGWNACQQYNKLCDNIEGTFPERDQLMIIYNNKSSLNNLLSTNGGTQLKEYWYWSSTRHSISLNSYYAVNMTNGYVEYNGAYGTNYIRCILQPDLQV